MLVILMERVWHCDKTYMLRQYVNRAKEAGLGSVGTRRPASGDAVTNGGEKQTSGGVCLCLRYGAVLVAPHGLAAAF